MTKAFIVTKSNNSRAKKKKKYMINCKGNKYSENLLNKCNLHINEEKNKKKKTKRRKKEKIKKRENTAIVLKELIYPCISFVLAE